MRSYFWNFCYGGVCKMKRYVIYIAGPYRGKNSWEVEKNIRNAEHYAFRLAEFGMVPLCPHSMYRYFDRTLNDEYWINATEMLLKRCDAVFLIPGWQNSIGATAEECTACRLEIPCFENEDDLFNWVYEKMKSGQNGPTKNQ
jgi:hypothetical protein